MIQASGTAWRRLVGNGPWRRGQPFGVLDIGSSKLCCYIARPRPGQGVQLLGRGYQLAEGLKGGEVVDAEAAEASVLAALHEAEQQSGETLREIWLAVSGGRPESSLCGSIARFMGEASPTPIFSSCSTALAARRPAPSARCLHAVPVEVSIDGGRPLRDACGLSGQRLAIVAHLVTVSGPALRNLLACLERCHVETEGVVCASYAAAIGCLAEDELERGCLVLDFGGGTTGFTHFAGGRLSLVGQVPYGGDHITGDLAYGLSTSRQHAERIKNLFGGTQFRSCDEGTRIEHPRLGDHAEMPTGRGAAHPGDRDRARPGRGDPGTGTAPPRRAWRASGWPAAALDRGDRWRQPARGHRGSGPGGVPHARPDRTAGALVGAAGGRSLLLRPWPAPSRWRSATTAASAGATRSRCRCSPIGLRGLANGLEQNF